jgi:hypothetical protein
MTCSWKLFGLVLLLTGCAQGVIGTLPKVSDPTRAATIVVARPFYFGGFAATYPITIDGVEVCELGMESTS